MVQKYQYLLEKNVNKLEDVTKDGIHIIIGIKSDKPAQKYY